MNGSVSIDTRKMPRRPEGTAEHPVPRRQAWIYALRTTNPPGGPIDAVTRWLVVTRAAVLPMTLLAGLVAALLAVGHPNLSPLDLTLAIVGILLAHTANNLMNDLFDTSTGSDSEAYPRALYAPHPILTGLVTKRVLLAAILATQLGDLAILVVLAARRGWPVAAFALAGLLLSYAYTAPPLRLKRIGLGELDVLITWGPLMIAGTYYSAVGALPWQVWVASIPYGLLCTTVLMGKHTDKIPFDRPAGIYTLPVLLGAPRARRATLGLLVAYYVSTALAVAVGALPWPALLALGALPLLRTVWPHLLAPAPAEPPKDFPVWPLWYAALCFVHVVRAGGLLVLGLLLAAGFGVRAF